MNLNLVFRYIFHTLVLYTCFRLDAFFRRLMMVRVVFNPSFYSEDCFDWDVILFNIKIFFL